MADTAAVADTSPVQEAAPVEKPLPAGQQGETVSLVVIYGKQKQDVTRPLDSTVLELKQLIEESTRITPEGQKLVNKGLPLKDDTATLRQAGIKPGAKLMLIGTPAPEVAAAQSLAAAGPSVAAGGGEWDAPVSNEPLSKQAQHSKVLAKGKPEDALPGIAGRQVTMPDDMVMLGGLCNSHGTRIRLTMKSDTQELWIGSAERTQKVPYSSITKIDSYPIEEQPEYSIISLNMGSGKYWVYWVPSQYVASIKIRIIGVHALL